MIAHNICYTTLLSPQDVDILKLRADVDYIVTPNNGKNIYSSYSQKHCRHDYETDLTSISAVRKKAST